MWQLAIHDAISKAETRRLHGKHRKKKHGRLTVKGRDYLPQIW